MVASVWINIPSRRSFSIEGASSTVSILIFFVMVSLPQTFLNKIQALGIFETPRLLVVSVSQQRMTLFVDREPKAEYIISTARNGVGQLENSNQTPLGLHRIKNKIGKDVPKGGIFENRAFKGQIWIPSPIPAKVPADNRPDSVPAVSTSDLITSRILWLEGMEAGYNAGRHPSGRTVDSYQRFIYIHGTNHEDQLGKPESLGCIRMKNDEVILLYDRVEEGDLVWIEE